MKSNKIIPTAKLPEAYRNVIEAWNRLPLKTKLKGLYPLVVKQLGYLFKEAVETFAEAMTQKAYARKLRRAYQTQNSVYDKERLFAAGDHVYEWDDYPDVSEVILYDSPLVSRADEIITVSGKSMEPQYYDGDKVLIFKPAPPSAVVKFFQGLIQG